MKIKICYFAVLFTVAPKQWNATGTGRWVSLIVVYYLYFSDETESVSAQNSTYCQNSRVFVSRYLGFLREEGGGVGAAGVCMSLFWILMVDISCIEEKAMSFLIFHYCIWDFPCDCLSFPPIFRVVCCQFFWQCYFAISRPCGLSEFYLKRASILCISHW